MEDEEEAKGIWMPVKKHACVARRCPRFGRKHLLLGVCTFMQRLRRKVKRYEKVLGEVLELFTNECHVDGGGRPRTCTSIIEALFQSYWYGAELGKGSYNRPSRIQRMSLELCSWHGGSYLSS